MKIEFTGRQTEIGDELRRVSERRLQKIARLLPSITRAHVVVTADKHRQIAEISLHSRQRDLTAASVDADARLALATAFDRLARQVEHVRSKRRVRKGAASPRLPAAAREQPADGGARVVRSRRAALKPMTLDEAALELDARGDGVLVFRDAVTERMTVLFRRKDGNLGLIEPEA